MIVRRPEGGTPLQLGLRAAIEARAERGLPVPQVCYEHEVDEVMGPGLFTASSTTTLLYDGPWQAGLDVWPSFEVGGQNYDQDVQDFLEAQLPGIWETYEFGTEPRTITIEEVLELSAPEPTVAVQGEASSDLSGSVAGPSSPAVSKEIVLGFTVDFLSDEFHFELKEEVCLGFLGCAEVLYVKCCFRLEFATGIRLPVRVNLDMPELMFEGDSYTPTTSLEPLDWDAAKQSAAGIPLPDGNEFLLKFDVFAGITVRVLGIDVLAPLPFPTSFERSFDASKSFCTPFGTTEMEDCFSFPIPEFTLTLFDGIPLIELQLVVQPDLGSQTINARWEASGDASGSGLISYFEPKPVVDDFGPVIVGDFVRPSVFADVRLSDFRYFFDRFEVDVGLRITSSGVLSFLDDVDIELFSLDLSGLTGDGLSVGVHDGTNDHIDGSALVASGPASMTILLPEEGATRFTNQIFSFSGVSFDPNFAIEHPASPMWPDDSVTWHCFNLDGGTVAGVCEGEDKLGLFGTGHTAFIDASTIGLGTHRISFLNSDALGCLSGFCGDKPASDSIDIIVVPCVGLEAGTVGRTVAGADCPSAVIPPTPMVTPIPTVTPTPTSTPTSTPTPTMQPDSVDMAWTTARTSQKTTRMKRWAASGATRIPTTSTMWREAATGRQPAERNRRLPP